MEVLRGSPRVHITISINPEFELGLDYVSILKEDQSVATSDLNKLEVGHARFTISSELGEITTGALLAIEYETNSAGQRTGWHLAVEPRQALVPLAEAMGKLVMAEAGDAIGRVAEAGIRDV